MSQNLLVIIQKDMKPFAGMWFYDEGKTLLALLRAKNIIENFKDEHSFKRIEKEKTRLIRMMQCYTGRVTVGDKDNGTKRRI